MWQRAFDLMLMRFVRHGLLRVAMPDGSCPKYGDGSGTAITVHLQHWSQRFDTNQHAIRTLYDDGFVRMWQFYLAACEQAFRYGRQAVFQFQLARRIDAVPLTRGDLYQPQRVMI